MRLLLAALVLAVLATAVQADTVWTYTGNSVSMNPDAPNLCGCALTGTVDFAGPLVLGQNDPVVSFSFTEGAYTFNNSNAGLGIDPFELTTQPFQTWFFTIVNLDGTLAVWDQNYDNGYETTEFGPGGFYVQGNHGTWVESSVPEPGTLTLLTPLAFLLLRLRRFTRRRNVSLQLQHDPRAVQR